MKTGKWSLILFFLFLFLFYGKDLFFNFCLNKDANLAEKIILESDYNYLLEDYNKLLVTNNLWNTMNGEFITSKVIVRDPYLFYDEATILKGFEDDVGVGDIIINDLGYIGKVKSVHQHYSQIELLTNKNTELQVKIKNSYGILRKKDNQLKVMDMTSNEQITIGDEVYTSSLTGNPYHILVGYVDEVLKTSLTMELVLTPSVDFQKMSYITIRKIGEPYEP